MQGKSRVMAAVAAGALTVALGAGAACGGKCQVEMVGDFVGAVFYGDACHFRVSLFV
mgnify:CR=1 FL=1